MHPLVHRWGAAWRPVPPSALLPLAAWRRGQSWAWVPRTLGSGMRGGWRRGHLFTAACRQEGTGRGTAQREQELASSHTCCHLASSIADSTVPCLSARRTERRAPAQCPRPPAKGATIRAGVAPAIRCQASFHYSNHLGYLVQGGCSTMLNNQWVGRCRGTGNEGTGQQGMQCRSPALEVRGAALLFHHVGDLLGTSHQLLAELEVP